MTPRPRRRRAAHVAGAALAVIVAASAANACSPAGSSRPPEASGPTSTPAPQTSASAPTRAIALDEHAAGRIIRVRVGTAVLVRLHSTYWSLPTSSDAQTLAPTGKSGGTPSGTCEPGAGCGTVAADFAARRTGTAHVSAHRNSCGEAMRCGPDQASYTVTVEII
jgi:hypothetical protein